MGHILSTEPFVLESSSYYARDLRIMHSLFILKDVLYQIEKFEFRKVAGRNWEPPNI